MSYEEIAQWSSNELETMFQLDKNKKDQPVSYYTMPDYKQLSKELAKPGVTMQLLWEEYAQEARLNHKIYSTSVKIYHNQHFLCEHPTKGTRPGAYSTNEHHLPEESTQFGKWNSTRYLE